jgi:hypothetical protein
LFWVKNTIFAIFFGKNIYRNNGQGEHER